METYCLSCQLPVRFLYFFCDAANFDVSLQNLTAFFGDFLWIYFGLFSWRLTAHLGQFLFITLGSNLLTWVSPFFDLLEEQREAAYCHCGKGSVWDCPLLHHHSMRQQLEATEKEMIVWLNSLLYLITDINYIWSSDFPPRVPHNNAKKKKKLYHRWFAEVDSDWFKNIGALLFNTSDCESIV